jgi:hypothetical protein
MSFLLASLAFSCAEKPKEEKKTINKEEETNTISKEVLIQRIKVLDRQQAESWKTLNAKENQKWKMVGTFLHEVDSLDKIGELEAPDPMKDSLTALYKQIVATKVGAELLNDKAKLNAYDEQVLAFFDGLDQLTEQSKGYDKQALLKELYRDIRKIEDGIIGMSGTYDNYADSLNILIEEHGERLGEPYEGMEKKPTFR